MKDRKEKSLTMRSEIFLLSFAFLAIVSLVFTSMFLDILYKNNIDCAKNSLRECNSKIVAFAEGIFHENATMVGMLSRDSRVINGSSNDPQEVLSIYDAILEDNDNITYIYSGYADGKLYIRDYDTPKNFDPTTRPWYQAAGKTDGVAREIYLDAATGGWMLSQSKKLVDSRGNMIGAVSIDCSNENISRQLSTKYQYDSQRSYIMNPAGTVLIHPEEKYINDSLLNYISEEMWNSMIEGMGNYGEYEKDGVNAMTYIERIPNTDLFVATAIDAKEVTRPIFRSIEYLLTVVVGISIILGFVLSRVLIYRFARPVMALKNRIERVAGGTSETSQSFGFSNAEINDIAEGIEIIVRDIARREEQRKAAEYLSLHDSMTGLYNRRFFEEEQQRLDTEGNYPLCVICCDINGLKLVNDVFGHDAGDQLICRIAECLTGACRTGDVTARIGGDEFAILLPHAPLIVVQEIIWSIRESFGKETICGAEVSASLGYGIKERKGESLEDVIRHADQMMYGWKLTESARMKRRTVENIIRAAARENLIKNLTEQEAFVLDQLASLLCPESASLLKQSYRFRSIGRCTLLQSSSSNSIEDSRRYTETAYRLLSAIDEYRAMAGYVLHYTEHWDGSGWPAGLSRWDIPLLSRILSVVDAYFAADAGEIVLEKQASWYDPEIVSALQDILRQSCNTKEDLTEDEK